MGFPTPAFCLIVDLFVCIPQEDICLSNCLNSHRYFSRGGILTVSRVGFHKLSLQISGLFTFIYPHIILTEYFLPLWTEETSNCKFIRRLMPSKIPFLPKTEAQCSNKHLNVIAGL